MFANNDNENVSFSEAYKSEILGTGKTESKEKSSLRKTLVILLVAALVIGIIIFAYLYFNETKEKPTAEVTPPKSSQMLDNIEELEEEALKEENQSENFQEPQKNPEKPTQPKVSEKVEKIKEEPKKESTQKGEASYLEQLAELSKEIDGEK